MEWKRRKKKSESAMRVQMRSGEQHPFPALRSAGQGIEYRLYQAVREAVPVVDAAVCKLIRLTGGLCAKCTDAEAERGLNAFLKTVPVGRGQYGFNAFLEQYLDSLLVYGGAVGEIVPTALGRDIGALVCGRRDKIEIREGESPMDYAICAENENGRMEPLPRQNLILFTALHPESAHPYGVSMLRSLPFMADVLMKIYHTIGVNWERCGNVRFAVTCKNTDGEASEQGQVLAREWSRAMQDAKSGEVRDFVAVGDVGVQVIGADAPILDSAVPVRQIMEQIVAKTGIPPFMLGLNWNSTERMSAQQADMLTTEITALRRVLTNAVERVLRTWLRMHGYTCEAEVVWDEINLQDQVEESRAALYREQARKLRIENDRTEGRAE